MYSTCMERFLKSGGLGILATDETTRTLSVRMAAHGMPPPDAETKKAYRQMLYTAPDLEKYLVGVILMDDMLTAHAVTGETFAQLLISRGLLVGVTADEGREPMEHGAIERVTCGAASLDHRLGAFSAIGVSFCKWRAEFRIGHGTPSGRLMERNLSDMVAFATACQAYGMLPLIEPDVLMQGTHSLQECLDTTTRILEQLFENLATSSVRRSELMLKLHMVTPGDSSKPAPPDEVAEATLRALSVLPRDLPIVAFLSGGQAEDATNTNLSAICRLARSRGISTRLTFSFGRSLQSAAMAAWKGEPQNVVRAQAALVASIAKSSASVFASTRDD